MLFVKDVIANDGCGLLLADPGIGGGGGVIKPDGAAGGIPAVKGVLNRPPGAGGRRQVNPAVGNRAELVEPAVDHLVNAAGDRPGVAGIPDPVEDGGRYRHLTFIGFTLGFSPDQAGQEFKVGRGEITATGVTPGVIPSSGGDCQLLAGIDGIAPEVIEALDLLDGSAVSPGQDIKGVIGTDGVNRIPPARVGRMRDIDGLPGPNRVMPDIVGLPQFIKGEIISLGDQKEAVAGFNSISAGVSTGDRQGLTRVDKV